MNFPTATDADWTEAQDIIRRLLDRHGVRGADADDAVQGWTVYAMQRRYATPPESPRHAAFMAVALVRRRGVVTLLEAAAGRRSRRRDNVYPVRESSPSWTDPARMAEAGEELAARNPRLAARLRQEGTTPAAAALQAAGWLQIDADDAARVSPSVPTSGPGYTPPLQGCPGLSTATDPNPASRERARLRCVNDWRRVAGLPPLAE